MKSDAVIALNDVIAYPAAGIEYIVVGWTPRGKLRLLNRDTMTERTCWWSVVGDLPPGYVLRPWRPRGAG